MVCVLLLLALSCTAAHAAPDSAAVCEAVRAAIGRQMAASGEKVVVESVRLPRLPAHGSRTSAGGQGVDWTSPGGANAEGSSWRVESLPAGPLRGNVTVMLTLLAGDSVCARIPVSCSVRTYGCVLVTVRRLDRHEALRGDAVVIQSMETTRLPSGTLSDPAQLAGMRTKRMVNQGSILYGSLCETMPAVRQGETVTLVIRSRGVRLTVSAVAKQDGHTGAPVVVQPVGSHDRVRSRVVDAHTVEVCTD